MPTTDKRPTPPGGKREGGQPIQKKKDADEPQPGPAGGGPGPSSRRT